MAFQVSKYMLRLREQLIQQKKTTESTADAYIRLLVSLNNRQPFHNLHFLQDVEQVKGKLGNYALSTRKNFLSGIMSVLSMMATSKIYKKLYKTYNDMFLEMKDTIERERGSTTEKTEKEKENWIDWEDVEKKRDELQKKALEIQSKATITPQQFETLTAYLLLCLYTYIPPRRNADFQQMVVVRDWNDGMPTNKNYLDLHGQRFIFNVYKTAKTHGQQIVEIPEDSPLRDALVSYLKQHHGYKATKNKSVEFPFLVKADGTPLTSVNSITRILNRLFGKRIGVSMLRHSYLSKKYGKVLEEMAEDADMMAHDGDTQRTYIRKPDEE